MTDATFKSAFADFAIEYELAHSSFEAAIAEAVSALEFPAAKRDLIARAKVEDLHVEVRDAVEHAFRDHTWIMTRARRALKQALRETAEG
jgi:hypothetical protein